MEPVGLAQKLLGVVLAHEFVGLWTLLTFAEDDVLDVGQELRQHTCEQINSVAEEYITDEGDNALSHFCSSDRRAC